jgi:hypothetical protein
MAKLWLPRGFPSSGLTALWYGSPCHRAWGFWPLRYSTRYSNVASLHRRPVPGRLANGSPKSMDRVSAEQPRRPNHCLPQWSSSFCAWPSRCHPWPTEQGRGTCLVDNINHEQLHTANTLRLLAELHTGPALRLRGRFAIACGDGLRPPFGPGASASRRAGNENKTELANKIR